MPDNNIATLQIYLRHPNVRRLLDFIANAEGADYDTGFGGTKIGLSQHPGTSSSFRDLSGNKLRTTAAGRYQFIKGTWDRVAKNLGLTDFSPQNQDLAALSLIQEKGALDDAMHGNFSKAVSKINGVWASLPGSPHNQKTVSTKYMDSFFNGDIKNRPSKYESQRLNSPAINPLTYQRTGNIDEQTPEQIANSIAMAQEFPEVQEQIQSQALPEDAIAQNQTPDLEGYGPVMPEDEMLTNAAADASTIPDGDVLNAPPQSLSSRLAQAYGEPTLDEYSVAAINDRADNIRNNAVTQFISGGAAPPTAPSLVMPKPLKNTIDQIMTDMSA